MLTCRIGDGDSHFPGASDFVVLLMLVRRCALYTYSAFCVYIVWNVRYVILSLSSTALPVSCFMLYDVCDFDYRYCWHSHFAHVILYIHLMNTYHYITLHMLPIMCHQSSRPKEVCYSWTWSLSYRLWRFRYGLVLHKYCYCSDSTSYGRLWYIQFNLLHWNWIAIQCSFNGVMKLKPPRFVMWECVVCRNVTKQQGYYLGNFVVYIITRETVLRKKTFSYHQEY